MSRIYGLIGAGGHGREMMPSLVDMMRVHDPAAKACFVVESDYLPAQMPTQINGHPIMCYDEFIAADGEKFFNIAISINKARQRLAENCLAAGIRAFPLIAGSAVILEQNDIGEGGMISHHSIITSNVKIGRFFQANVFVSVSHDCVIGDYVTFSPGVRCNGHVHVGDHVFVGTGAIIRNGNANKPLVIGEGAVIGMGAVVTKDVPPNVTVVGNPAKPVFIQMESKK